MNMNVMLMTPESTYLKVVTFQNHKKKDKLWTWSILYTTDSITVCREIWAKSQLWNIHPLPVQWNFL